MAALESGLRAMSIEITRVAPSVFRPRIESKRVRPRVRDAVRCAVAITRAGHQTRHRYRALRIESRLMPPSDHGSRVLHIRFRCGTPLDHRSRALRSGVRRVAPSGHGSRALRGGSKRVAQSEHVYRGVRIGIKRVAPPDLGSRAMRIEARRAVHWSRHHALCGSALGAWRCRVMFLALRAVRASAWRNRSMALTFSRSVAWLRDVTRPWISRCAHRDQARGAVGS